MIAGALVPDSPVRYNDGTVLNGLVQHPAGAEENQGLRPHGKDLLRRGHAGRRAYRGHIHSNRSPFVIRLIHRDRHVGYPGLPDLHSAKTVRHAQKSLPGKAGNHHLRHAANRFHHVSGIHHRLPAVVKFLQNSHKFPPLPVRAKARRPGPLPPQPPRS